MKKLGKYSMGIGDRFGRQAGAQLKAIIDAGKKGVEITPVWNKSNREHIIIGTEPADVRKEADEAVKAAKFKKPYFVDADHINFDTVGRFIEASDFFTIDVAAYIGQRACEEDIKAFMKKAAKYKGKLRIQGIPKPFNITSAYLKKVAEKYLFATKMAGVIYRKIEKLKGAGKFVTEVSMDEVPDPQTPAELFFILMMLSIENIPLQTIAPKFQGRFNKGVDYVGNPELFALEFETDLLVIRHAVKLFKLPENLKISVHSGSDKFALYPHIGSIIRKYDAGIHLKTAGTTWLEEVTGLAMAGGEALTFVKEMYKSAYEKIDELCAPYADVIDIKKERLPSPAEVMKWDSEKLSSAIIHDAKNPNYNPDMRQLIHVGYKLAALRMKEYLELLDKNKDVVSRCVYENIYSRHICRLFGIG
ncbi:MAG TPA: tagaturonate epimerase family protein [Bacteroidales bacterium]|nr:tagaturonate epimerase family protein [Bacteroidales bacterium]HOK76066.1 tagaturonate epimerase family protein [Bacteroidales bacterium]HOM41467.1 tagaturonate epimerase family protein [Bacteroidales bacterium]HPP93435.1 tagaturonate epimerase family protein [Bacteroidales bacterium]HRR17043.1 tagaturonate epimerase family protein [Bacteroidales bacterium]